MTTRNGNGRKRQKGLLGAVKRHPIRTAGIAAGALLGLTLIRKAANGRHEDDRGDRDGAAAARASGGGRARRGSRGRSRARGVRGGRSQTRAEAGRGE